MTSRRLVTAALVSASVATAYGCEVSTVDPDANVQLSGTVVTATGDPASGIAVSLLKRPDVGEVIGGLTVGFATVGLVCTLESPPAICRSARKTATSYDGRFNFGLRGSDTRGSVGNADTLSVTAASGKGSEATSVAFRVQRERVVLPALRLWDARLEFDPTTLAPRWQPLPRGTRGDTTVAFADVDGRPVWEQAHARSRGRFDARPLEDAEVTARVRTDASVNRRTGSYDFQYLSAEAHVTGVAGAPDSRGAACITPRPEGVRGVQGAPCWLTDGDLAQGPAIGVTRHSAVVVDLGSQRPISLIVVRGDPVDRMIAVSTDGRRFRPIGTRHGVFEQFSPGGLPARYLRLQTPGGVQGTRELSVWE